MEGEVRLPYCDCKPEVGSSSSKGSYKLSGKSLEEAGHSSRGELRGDDSQRGVKCQEKKIWN